MIDVEKFKEEGYIVIPKLMPNHMIAKCKNICLSIKQSLVDINNVKKFDSQVIQVASFISPELFSYYTSEFMYDIATTLLETDIIYLFNDQIVVKLPNEKSEFQPHTDNQYGPNNDLALQNKFKTITCAWILDDFTNENGPVSILNKKTNEWDTPLPKKGDIVVWDGNTLHKSSFNLSDTERVVWLCVYSTQDLTSIKPILSDSFNSKSFYCERFEKNKMVSYISTYKNKYTAQQKQDVWEVFEKFLLKEKFERIFEIGTASGGLTQFLYEFSKENNIDTEIMSVDIKPPHQHLLDIGINNLQLNVFDIKNVNKFDSFLKTNKKLLILCDGGEKPSEFDFFAKYLKVGDFIMAHDYAISYEYFETNIRKQNKWNWCQITEDDIVGTCTKFNLIDYTDLNFVEEMWACKTKKENTKKILL